MENRKLFLIGILIFFIVANMSNILAFCNAQGYVFNSTGSPTRPEIVYAVCVDSGGNTTQTQTTFSDNTYGMPFGGLFDDCGDVCDIGMYVNASNSTYNIYGEVFNTSSVTDTFETNITMTGLPAPTVTIVTPTSDYTYTTGTTNYDATCVAGDGSVDEIIFTSNHTGSNTNYSYIDAQVTNPSGDTYRFTMPSLSAGVYLVYEWFCNQTNSQSDTDGPQGITINQATGVVYAYLNASRSNISTDVGTYVNLSALLNTGTGSIKLYNNGTLINQGTGTIYNYTLFGAAGLYNISAIYDGNNNYTADIETWWVNVTADATIPYFTTIPANASVNYGDTWDADFDATDDGGNFDSFSVNDSRFTIGAANGTLTNATFLGAGTYILNVSINDTVGNSNYTIYRVIVNSINPPIIISILPSSSETYPTQTNATANGCPAEIACNFYLDDSPITSSDVRTFGVGSYNYSYNTSGNQNYSSYMIYEILSISSNSSTCNIYFNESSGITYPASFIVYTDCDTTYTLYRNGTSIANGSEQILGAGAYNFSVIRTDQQNYSNIYDEEEFVVQQATSEVATYLNASRSNLTIELGTYADLNGSMITPITGNIKLYNNGTLINQGANTINNVTQFNSYGESNITTFYDGNENYTGDYETWYIIVEDNTPPQFTFIENISVYENESVYSDINASDASTICFDVNDSDFSINCDGILQNATTLSIGMHWLNITANDTYGNENYSVIYVNVTAYPDFNPPRFTVIPSNASLNYGVSLNVDFDAVDNEGHFDSFMVNDSRFTINSTGALINTTSLGVNVYVMNVSINDTAGNYNWTLYRVTVSASSSSCNVHFNETTVTYPASFVVYTDCDTTYTLYRNGTIISNNSEQSLGVGIYNFTVIREDQQNYSNTYNETEFSVSQGTPSLDITITPSNSEEYGTQTTADASGCPGEITCNFYRNDTGSVSDPDTVTLGVGVYNYTYNTTGNENYSATSYSETLTITQNTSADCGVYFSASSPVTYPATFNIYTNCTSAYTLYRNGTSISNGSLQSLGAGTYNFTVIRTDQSNYSNYYDEEEFVIQQATPTLYYYLNGVTNNVTVTYPNTINASVSTDIGSAEIYRNSSNVTSQNNIDVGLAAGYYKYDFNVTGNENYSSVSNTLYATVNQATGIIYAYLNNSRANMSTNNDTYVNLSALLNTGEGVIKLYNNGSLINQGTGVIYNNTHFTSLGIYNISAIYDGNDNYTSDIETWYLNVSGAPDITKPNISFVSPTTAEGNYTQDFIESNVTADDETTLDTITIFLYNSSGLITQSQTSSPYFYNFTSLSDGTYYLNATANDTTNNENQTETRTIILDNEPPYFTNIANQTLYGNESLSYDINAADEGVGVKCFSVNDTTNFTIDCNGLLENITTLVGTYWLNVSVNDSFGHTAYAIFYVNMSEESVCGNGILEAGEECDDGNIVSGDGCTELCIIERQGGGRREVEEEEVTFEVEPDSIVVDLFRGESETETITITNTFSETLTFAIDYGDLVEFIEISDAVVTLDSEESRDIEVDIYAPLDKAPDAYFGKIVIVGDGAEERINVVINIKEREALFDIRTSVLTRVVQQGKDAEAEIELTNIGDLEGSVDVNLYYSLLDFNNNTMNHNEEIVRVDGRANLIRKLQVPETAVQGSYMFYAKVTYDTTTAASADVFFVGTTGNWILFIIAIIIVITTAMTVIILHRRNVFATGVPV